MVLLEQMCDRPFWIARKEPSKADVHNQNAEETTTLQGLGISLWQLSSSKPNTATMTTVKPPKKDDESSVWKVVVLLIAVLGTAFLLYKQDPYTNAILTKEKKASDAAAAALRGKVGQEVKVMEVAKTDGTLESRTIVLELSQLNNNAKGEIKIQTKPDWAPLGVAQFHKLVDQGFYNDARFFRVGKFNNPQCTGMDLNSGKACFHDANALVVAKSLILWFNLGLVALLGNSHVKAQ